MTSHHNGKLINLTWWDILVLTLIMFSYFIYSSLIGYINLTDKLMGEVIEYTNDMNWDMLSFQMVLLVSAMLYLWLRNFNFAQWPITINLKAIVQGVGIFLVVALAMDLFSLAAYYLVPPSENIIYTAAALPKLDFSLLLYSVLNGFYEEIFFLGICLAVTRDQRLLFILYSLLIRYAFHTYQGQIAAISIALVIGGVFYFFYIIISPKNLFPFFLAHAFADMFGMGILNYLYGII